MTAYAYKEGDYVFYAIKHPHEYAGFLIEGYPVQKNGQHWRLPPEFDQPGPLDCRTLVAVGDVIDYPTGHSYRVSFVDEWTVAMVGPI